MGLIDINVGVDVEIGTRRFTKVKVMDDKGAGGANHVYTVLDAGKAIHTAFAQINFQKGPIGEEGVNGCHHEDLLAVLIHRLESFQAGEYACEENTNALIKLKEAMHWLKHRTEARSRRGVEGTSEK